MNNKILYTIIGLLGALVVGALIYIFTLRNANSQKDEDLAAMKEMAAFEKEQLEAELENQLAEFAQFDGFQVNITNDSLVQLLGQEKQHVQELLEELRITKATDAKKIAQLKKEIATLREVMKTYVAQIDSLSHTNKILVQENTEVKQKYEQATQVATTLAQEKKELTEVVTRAAMMEITRMTCTTLNKSDKKTNLFSKIKKLQFDFTVGKNITTTPGDKTVYVQLRRPNSDLMLTSEANTFTYENQRIPYSIKKTFEYAGEATDLTVYWAVGDEELVKGTYTIEFFIDGSMCGSFPVKLD